MLHDILSNTVVFFLHVYGIQRAKTNWEASIANFGLEEMGGIFKDVCGPGTLTMTQAMCI